MKNELPNYNKKVGGYVVFNKDGKTAITNDGTKGGYFYGDSHQDPSNGISAIVDNDRPILVEGNEVIINKKTVQSEKVLTIKGTPKEILSTLNQMDGNGVAIGDEEAEILAKYRTGGSIPREKQIYLGKEGGSNVSPRGMFESAVQMENEGIDSETIRSITGWFRSDLDGLWRYEISDNEMEIICTFTDKEINHLKTKNNYIQRHLKDVIKHEELFKAYPRIKYLKVLFVDSNNSDVALLDVSNEGVMFIICNLKYEREISDNRGGTKELGEREISDNRRSGEERKAKRYNTLHFRKVITHELQHAIQINEGLAEGGNPNIELKKLKTNSGAIQSLTEKEQEYIATQRYLNKAGEIEAMSSDVRIDYNDLQRRRNKPYSEIAIDPKYFSSDLETKIKFREGGRISKEKHKLYLGEEGGMGVSPRGMFESAVQMENEGIDSETIRSITGWFRNPFDKLWRFEISDREAKINLSKIVSTIKKVVSSKSEVTLSLKDVYTNNELSKAYGKSIEELPFMFYYDEEYEGLGRLSIIPLAGKVFIKLNVYEFLRGNVEEVESTVAERGKLFISFTTHELQHAIQIREGLSAGGSVEQEYRKLFKGHKGVPGREDRLENNRKTREDILLEQARLNYLNHLGEIEASDSDVRKFFDKKTRIEIPPYSLINFNNEEVIVVPEIKIKFDEGGRIPREKQIYLGKEGGSNVSAKGMFEEAIDMEKAGFQNEEIRKKTGWFRSELDDLWRYEISDKDMEVKIDLKNPKLVYLKNLDNPKIGFNTTLSEIVEHKELFKAYPKIKDLKVSLYFSDGNSIASVFIDSFGKINIKLNLNSYERDIFNNGRTYRESDDSDSDDRRKTNIFRQILCHELQHCIQINEGLSAGTNFDVQLEKVQLENFGNEKLSEEEQKRIAKKRFDNSVGEIEAMSSAARINLDELQRKLRKPYSEIAIDDKYINFELEAKIKFKTGGSIGDMTPSELKEFYASDEGKKLDAQTYSEWNKLVNMTKSELEKFYNSVEGKEAGLTTSQAKEQGIDSGRESARWVLKMKDIPYKEWSSDMWRWAKKQIGFIKRMTGMRGKLYNDKGEKTRRHTALLIWGHNPEQKFKGGGDIKGYDNFKNPILINGFISNKEIDGKEIFLITYNSGGQEGLDVHQTMNPLAMLDAVEKKTGLHTNTLQVFIYEHTENSNRIETEDELEFLKDNYIVIIVDRDSVEFYNGHSPEQKFAEGGGVPKDAFTKSENERNEDYEANWNLWIDTLLKNIDLPIEWTTSESRKELYGDSFYITIFNEDWQEFAKLRFSGHSVMNTSRLQNEFHNPKISRFYEIVSRAMNKGQQDKHPEKLVRFKGGGELSQKALAVETNDLTDFVRKYFIKDGRIDVADAMQELFGNRRGKSIADEYRKRIGLHKKGGLTISQLAHNLWEQHRDEVREGIDDSDFRNAVEEVLISEYGVSSMIKSLMEKSEGNEQDRESEYWMNQYDEGDDEYYNDLSDEEVNNYFMDMEGFESELVKGTEHEMEHLDTLKKVAEGKLTPEQAVVQTAKTHIKENPEYYEDLQKMELENEESIPDLIEGLKVLADSLEGAEKKEIEDVIEGLEILLESDDKFAEGGSIGSVLWATKIGEPDYNEQLITENPSQIEDAKKWALANGFDRIRVLTIDNSKPDFTKGFKKYAEGGEFRMATGGRIVFKPITTPL